jgi:hypothetical protein
VFAEAKTDHVPASISCAPTPALPSNLLVCPVDAIPSRHLFPEIEHSIAIAGAPLNLPRSELLPSDTSNARHLRLPHAEVPQDLGQCDDELSVYSESQDSKHDMSVDKPEVPLPEVWNHCRSCPRVRK